MTQFSDERGAELREFFFETAQDLLQSLNEEALKLEKRPGDVETVRSIRRTVHTLKGDAAACACRELSELAHELEDALAMESAAADASLAEIAFKAADVFGAMLTAYQHKSKLPSTEALRKMVRGLTGAPKAGKGRKPAKKSVRSQAAKSGWTEYEKLAVQSAVERGDRVYHVTSRIDPNCAMPLAGRQLVLNAVAPLGEVLAARPEAG